MSGKTGTFKVSQSAEYTIQIPYSKFVFSGGEVQVKLEYQLPLMPWPITIVAFITCSDNIIELLLLVDALRRRYPHESISLVIPYLPYARQDRAMNSGESLSLRVMCDLINGLNFKSVTVWDVHSDVALALLNNVTNIYPSKFISKIPVSHRSTILVAPDAGALKKVSSIAISLGYDMVRADKTRSVVDGSITGTVVYCDGLVNNRDFLIVDDICDGGRTFTELAKELRKHTTGKVLLYVTHGIFSKGFDPFKGLIDYIYVANPFPTVDLSNPIIIKL